MMIWLLVQWGHFIWIAQFGKKGDTALSVTLTAFFFDHQLFFYHSDIINFFHPSLYFLMESEQQLNWCLVRVVSVLAITLIIPVIIGMVLLRKNPLN